LAANKRKILESARKHVQKGAQDKAFKEYERLLKLDPRDAKLQLEVGEVHRRWGRIDSAIAAYSKVALQYMNEGFDARAVAVYKQIQNLDPERYETYAPLAELYQRMGLTTEAINALQTAADGYHRAGKHREALNLLRKMAMVDPSNTTSRIKVADLLRQEELHSEAIAEYEAVADEMERHNDSEALEGVLERILEIEPDNVATLLRLTRSLVGRDMAARAEPFARRALTAQPDVPENYELLAEVYRSERREDALADVYQRLADLYDSRGDKDRAREIRQRFGTREELSTDETQFSDVGEDDLLGGDSLDGGDSDFVEKSTLVADIGSGFLQESELGDTGTVEGDVSALLEDDVLDQAATMEPVPVEEMLVSPPPPAFDPEQLLAEASVYLRYGKGTQAIENLEAILAREPGHRAALEKLGEAFSDGDEGDLAVQAWRRAAERAREDGDERAVSVLRGRIAALDEDAAMSLDSDAAGTGDEEVALEESASLAPDLSEDDELDLEVDTDELDLELGDIGAQALDEAVGEDVEGDSELDVDVSGIDGEAGDAALDVEGEVSLPDVEIAVPETSASASAIADQIDEQLEEADFYKQQGLLDEAEAIYRRLLELAPNHSLVLLRLGEIATARGEDTAASSASAAPPLAEPQSLAEPESLAEPQSLAELESLAEPQLGSEPGEDLSDLDEETSVAYAAVAEVPEETDRPTLEVEASDQVDVDLDPGDTGTITCDEVETEPSGNANFDLAAELGDALCPDPNEATSSGSSGTVEDGFEAVFSEFKKGVSEALSEGDHDAHYDLGIAYREMGLLDDAIGEFRSAMQSPALRIDSLHMLGLCALDRNEPRDAISHLEQVLVLPDASDEQKLAARFETGRAFEALGDAARAREAWEVVAAVDGSFCGVGERLARLGASTAAGAPLEAETDEYESFDDVIAEASVDSSDDTEASIVPEVDEADAAPEPPPKPQSPSRKKKKKKISFL
jgi:tetratricopeptide (TPR) repeat protein